MYLLHLKYPIVYSPLVVQMDAVKKNSNVYNHNRQ